MAILSRRCRSEHVAATTPNSSQFLPSHMATKLREPQLVESKLNFKVSENLQTWVGNSLQADQSLPLPTSPLRSTSRMLSDSQRLSRSRAITTALQGRITPSLSTPDSQPNPLLLQTQLDGTDNFPLIDSVISNTTWYHDNNRARAESEFYECMDDQGVKRRRSAMRTVERDDLLRCRGANPRTGLVTPDLCSLAGSQDPACDYVSRPRGPSAQWKLKDDQWVCEVQDLGADPMCHGTSSDQHAQSTPLTASNLRTFSDRAIVDVPISCFESPSTEAVVDVREIRRKPVGSPPKNSRTRMAAGPPARSVSDGTIIHTSPSVFSSPIRVATSAFFGPDDLESVRKMAVQEQAPHHTSPPRPFLEVLVKPCQDTLPQVHGFTRKKSDLEKLQQCLRTNGGPYPWTHSMPRENHLQQGGTYQRGRRENETCRKRRGNPRAFPPAAPRAYLVDSNSPEACFMPHATHNDLLRENRNKPQIWGEMYQWNAITPTEGRKVPQITCSMPNSVKLKDLRNEPLNRGQSKNLSVLQGQLVGDLSASLMASMGNNWVVPDRTETSPTIMCMSKKRSRDQVLLTVCGSQSQLESRNRAAAHPPKLASVPTCMEEQIPLKSTGMSKRTEEMQPSEEDADASDKSVPPPSAFPVTKSEADITVLPSSDSLFIPGRDGNRSLADHSACCPRCCVESDCHESCLGHGAGNCSDVSEAHSLVSMGIFDVGFKTSVSDINKALLEPRDRHESTFLKLKNVFVKALWHGNKMSAQQKLERDTIPRTLRQTSTSREDFYTGAILARSTINGPKHTDSKHAKLAAKTAMAMQTRTESSASSPSNTSKIRTAKAKAIVRSRDHLTDLDTASESRKVSASTKARSLESQRSEELVTQKGEGYQPVSRLTDVSDISTIGGKISRFVLHDNFQSPFPLQSPFVVASGLLCAQTIKDMICIVLDTFTALSCIVCDYKRTGHVVIPAGATPSEFVGNCIRTLFYLTVAAFFYALFVKVSRVVLCLIRIVLLPIRLWTWIVE